MRAALGTRRRPSPSADRPTSRIAIGRPIARKRPAGDLSFQPLYLLVPGESARRSGAAADLAIEAAERFSGGRSVLLIDLDPEDSHLRDRVGAPAGEGIAEALEFGISLTATRHALKPGLHFVPLGTPAADPTGLYENPAWDRIIAKARRDDVRLLAYVPPIADRIAAIGRFAGAVLLLTGPEEEQRLRAVVPPGTPVVGVLTPAATTPAMDRSASAPETSPPDDPVATGDLASPRSEGPHSVTDPADRSERRNDAAGERPGSPAGEERDEAEDRLARSEDDATGAIPEPIPFDLVEAQETSNLEAALAGALQDRAPQAPDATAERAPSQGTTPAAESSDAPLDPPDGRRYTVPGTSPAQERAIHFVGLAIIAYWTYYIVWRWMETLNPDALWFSVPLALAETWGWISAILLLFTVWRLRHRVPSPAPTGLSVDVFITTYDEPLTIIRRTAIGAREIRYPHRTFILDDGRRDEVKAMAREVGIEYITRPNNEHAKAGNLNHALKKTSGDFVVQFDADHVPLPAFLDRVLGFFADPRVAFVQTPQDFYNLDSFTADVDERCRRLWEDQKLFFSVIQPGKDNWNSAFFCGSCAAFRRTALEDLGGFSDQTVTEDIETSLRLHARGWKSVYYGESLSYGLAAHSAKAFHVQHDRWARGAMQVLRRFNPLTYGKLSIAQRISYFYSLSGYGIGLQKLIFYLSPLVFFATGVLPIQALDSGFLARFVPYLLLSILFVELLARGLGFTWIAERYHMAKFWTYTLALPAYLTKRRLPFRVTPKEPGRVPLSTYAPQLLLVIASVAAVYWATIAYAFSWIDYGVPGWDSLAFQLNFIWAGINFALAASVVRLSTGLKHRRRDYRFTIRAPIRVRSRRPRSALSDENPAVMENLNSSGIAFRGATRYPPGTTVNLALPLSTGEIAANATIVYARTTPSAGSPEYIHGAKFIGLALASRDAIELHCARFAVGAENVRYRTTRRLQGIGNRNRE